MESAFEVYFNGLRSKTVAVIGLGVSNRPLVRLLLEYGCRVIGCDRTPREQLDHEILELEQAGCQLQVGNYYLENLKADVVFRTPGMHPENPALLALKRNGAEITSEMEVFFEVCPCSIIGVTGSDGKTTTTTLISEMLKEEGRRVWLGGNIGMPLLPEVRQMKPSDWAVVELSSFQLMDMHRSPQIAVITNLAPNHLDVHKSMEEYVEAKKNIYRYQDKSGILVVNDDNTLTSACIGRGKTKFFSRRRRTNGIWADEEWIYRQGFPVSRRSEILLPGNHNVENYMAAMLAVEGIVSDQSILKVMRTFGGVEHRIELVRVRDGVSYYNDSIASSPSRTIAGLRSFSQQVLLIAGGYDKQIPFEVLGPEVCSHVKKLFLNGATAAKIRAAVEAAPQYRPGCPEIVDCTDFTSAVRAAADAAHQGDIVLMSPACAAFDQFKNFMVRGNYFKKLIKEL